MRMDVKLGIALLPLIVVALVPILITMFPRTLSDHSYTHPAPKSILKLYFPDILYELIVN